MTNKAREASVQPPPAKFTVRVGTGDSPVPPGKARQLSLRGLGHALRLFAFERLLADVFGEGESASEPAVLTLHATIVLFFLFLLELALAVHRQSVVLDADIDVLLVDSRHFDFQDRKSTRLNSR